MLLALPVVGWIALLLLAARRPAEIGSVQLTTSAISRIGRLRSVRNAALVATTAVAGFGVVGRVFDTDWSTMLLGSAVVAVAVVWFVARAVETAMLSRAQVAVTTQA